MLLTVRLTFTGLLGVLVAFGLRVITIDSSRSLWLGGHKLAGDMLTIAASSVLLSPSAVCSVGSFTRHPTELVPGDPFFARALGATAITITAAVPRAVRTNRDNINVLPSGFIYALASYF